jgi:hypothetical protein
MVRPNEYADRVNNAIEDLGDVIGGGVPVLGRRNSVTSRFYYASDGKRFGDSGFAAQFQDGSDQVRHFIGGLVTGYRCGALGGELLSQGREIKEFFGIHGEVGFSAADLYLNNLSTQLGGQLKSDPSSILQLPSQVQQGVEPPPSTSSYSDSPTGSQPMQPTPPPPAPPPPPKPPYLGTWRGSYSVSAIAESPAVPSGSIYGNYSGNLTVTISSMTSNLANISSASVTATNIDNQTVTFTIPQNPGPNFIDFVHHDYEFNNLVDIIGYYDSTYNGQAIQDSILIDGVWGTDNAGDTDNNTLTITNITMYVFDATVPNWYQQGAYLAMSLSQQAPLQLQA